MQKEYGISMMETLRKNKAEMPPEFLAPKEENKLIFGFDENKVSVSFALKKKKRNVLLLSTLGELYNNNINKNTKNPEIITFYNSTKSGTDTFDQFCSLYSASRKTNN